MKSVRILNPYDLPEADEFPHAPTSDNLWTENYCFYAFDAAADVGVFVHFGAMRGHTELWRAVFALLLPNQEMLVGKTIGKHGTAKGPSTGVATAECISPFQEWSVRYYGMARPIRRSDLYEGPLRDGPSAFVKLDLTFEACAPIWSMERAMHGNDIGWMGHAHNEQAAFVRGTVTTDSGTSELNALGYRDHSVGPRDSTKGPGVSWSPATFPSGRTFLVMRLRGMDSSQQFELGYAVAEEGGAVEPLTILDGPIPTSADTISHSVPVDPLNDGVAHSVPVEFNAPKSGLHRVQSELVNHSMACTWLKPSDMVAGTDWSGAPTSKHMSDVFVKYEWDGEIGYGLRERGCWLSHLSPPDGSQSQ